MKVKIVSLQSINNGKGLLNGAELNGETKLAQNDTKLLSHIRLTALIPPSTKEVILSKKDVHFNKSREQQGVFRYIFKLLKNKVNPLVQSGKVWVLLLIIFTYRQTDFLSNVGLTMGNSTRILYSWK